MEPEEKKMLRKIVRRVHPDLFVGQPKELTCNSDSLKLLNTYLDGITSGTTEEVKLKFWVSEESNPSLVPIRATLPSWGSLGPLFYAFGLISEDQLLAGVGRCKNGVNNISILSWLGSSLGEATKAADEHENLRSKRRELRLRLEDRFKLAAIQLGGEFSISTTEQNRQIEALQTLEACLVALSAEQADAFEGLSFKLYHPHSDNLETMSFLNPDGSYNLHGSMDKSYVGEDGTLHVVAERSTIKTAVASLNLDRARLLTQVACFWMRRSRDLAAAVRDLLGVERVWCDNRTEQANQKFVLWAGEIVNHRRHFKEVLRGQKFRFSLLVHDDESAPEVDFLASSSVLQVRSDSGPEVLTAFMTGSVGAAADVAAADAATAKAEEERVLEDVRQKLGMRSVIRVCSSSEHKNVIQAALRLLENADAIQAAGINLKGANLAIDDCYEVWESGFISIPHDFQLQDLQPKLRRMQRLAAPKSTDNSSYHPVGESSSLPQLGSESLPTSSSNSQSQDQYSAAWAQEDAEERGREGRLSDRQVTGEVPSGLGWGREKLGYESWPSQVGSAAAAQKAARSQQKPFVQRRRQAGKGIHQSGRQAGLPCLPNRLPGRAGIAYDYVPNRF